MGLYKRGKTWWYCYSFAGKQIRESTETSNKRIAKSIFQKKVEELIAHKYNIKNPEKINFFHLCKKYEEYSKTNKPISYKTEKGRMNIMKQFFNDIPILFFKNELIEKFKTFILDRGNAQGTVNRHLAMLKHMMTMSYEWFGIPIENPVKKVKMFKEINRVRYLLENELNLILTYAESHLKTAIYSALYTGARSQELFNLKWDDIDFTNKIIKIHQYKTKQEILIPLLPDYEHYLKSVKRESDYVIHFKGLKVKSLKRSFWNLLKKCNINDFRFHDLRRTAGTYLYLNGVGIRSIQKIMGHKNINTTLKYVTAPSDFLVQEMKKLKYPITILSQSQEEKENEIN